MSPGTHHSGLPVSEGVAIGRLYLADTGATSDATADQVRAAFAAVAAGRRALADRLRAAGRDEEAGIVGVGALIAVDPALVDPAAAAVRDGSDATAAVQAAAAAQAAILEALPSQELAERAGDVRQVARAVLDHLAGGAAPARPAGEFILARREVGPADLIELAETGLVGAVSVNGGASSHASIIARGLGVPMLTGMDAAVLAASAGQLAILDADEGELIVAPANSELQAATDRAGRDEAPRHALTTPRTQDGQEISVMCNVASAAETTRGLAAGASGVGLLRTEIPFTGAHTWPTLAEHQAKLAPVLGLLAGRPATVRLLDYSGDKIPPFLAGTASGLAALLAHPRALRDQLHAVLEAGRDTRLAVLVPMVATVAEVRRVREVLAATAAALGTAMPALGIMVEVPATAAAAEVFAPEVGFFSIGSNDLTGSVLGLDRRDPRARPALAADPRVLALIAHIVDAARASGVSVSVCGDAAADPAVLPLLVGLGVDTLSVPAARVARVRAQMARLDTRACAALAGQAMRAATVTEVWDLVGVR